MDVLEFVEFIESIGFKNKSNNGSYYIYKFYRINLYEYIYDFYNGSKWYYYDYNDLRSIEKYFKRELRSIKLKELLR